MDGGVCLRLNLELTVPSSSVFDVPVSSTVCDTAMFTCTFLAGRPSGVRTTTYNTIPYNGG